MQWTFPFSWNLLERVEASLTLSHGGCSKKRKKKGERESNDGTNSGSQDGESRLHTEIGKSVKKSTSYEKVTPDSGNNQKDTIKFFSLHCPTCGAGFNRKRELDRHQVVHTGERNFMCPICGMRFRWKTNVQRHLLVHTTQKTHECSMCKKCFRTNGNLKEHMAIHSEDKSFKCPMCDKLFRVKSNLTRHLRVHSGERNYKCSTCDRFFRTKGNLKGHLLRHSGIKSYVCSKCDKAFYTNSHLKLHMQVHWRKENKILVNLGSVDSAERMGNGSVFESEYADFNGVRDDSELEDDLHREDLSAFVKVELDSDSENDDVLVNGNLDDYVSENQVCSKDLVTQVNNLSAFLKVELGNTCNSRNLKVDKRMEAPSLCKDLALEQKANNAALGDRYEHSCSEPLNLVCSTRRNL